MKLFGSSGIRGKFGELITPEFACRLGMAVGSRYRSVVVGWDTRPTGQPLARAAMAGLASAGCDVSSAGMVSTPTLANAAREFGAGIMVTASHNPPEDNGFKFWNPDGSSFGMSQMDDVERALSSESMPLAKWDRVGSIASVGTAVEDHIRRISELIGSLDAKVVVDCGNGAATTITPALLRRLGCEVLTLNDKPDGSFPGRGSEPTEENTKPLARLVVETGADIGLAHDGDADRVVAVDEKGNFAGGDALLPLLCRMEGRSKVVVPINASMAVERALGKVQVIRTRVGDVYVSEKIKETGADFGGEPSGTWVFPKITYCPDGIYAAARLVQIASERPLSERLAEMPRFYTVRKRLDMSAGSRDRAMSRVSETLKSLNPLELSDLDGIRAVFGDGWMLFRPSGTEPKLKIVVEAESKEAADRLLEKAMDIGKEAVK